MTETLPPRFDFAPGLSLARIAPPLRLRDYRVAAFDMDSTLISIECIDELATLAGRGEEVAAITELAMRGEISDYAESLRRRLALLRGTPQEALEQVWAERLRLNPGAEALIRAFQAAGLKVLLVSGGFSFFTDRLKSQLGLDQALANELAIENGRLTGEVVGEIVDAEAKARTLLALCHDVGCSAQQSIAIGDGANDLLMMRAAGLSVAFQAKPRVRAEAHVAIDQGGLDRLLELFEAG